MTELDLTQVLPRINLGNETLITHEIIGSRRTTIADLLSCLAALPVDTRVAVVSKVAAELGDTLANAQGKLIGAAWAEAEKQGHRASQAESALSTATSRIAEIEAESAWRAIEWDDPSTYPPEPQLVLVVLKLAGNDKPLVSQAAWEAESERWIDIETDGQNDHIEWAPGEVTHWRPMPKPPEER